MINTYTNPEQTDRLTRLGLEGDHHVVEDLGMLPVRTFSLGMLWDLVYLLPEVYDFDTNMDARSLIEALVQILELYMTPKTSQQ